ncbi:PREDICTED: glutathione S-transferase 1-like [Polistes dominula]|uniref:Glutathione S-transferase 1-like n=1 Tax=Polistes dominula TaxID=743375 RepID=A0ABM1HY90_POLDO|nr:PREDICTED: glutathione S-transferase 1-like [Polistes dominula]
MSLKTFVNKSVPTLYMTELSPPVRSVLMTAYILGLPLYKKEINLISGEQRMQEYLQMNPQGTVPLLQDKDYCLWDSHAISGYLVDEYGKSDMLYPKDSRKRALVDQRLHFDTGILYPEFRNIVLFVPSTGKYLHLENWLRTCKNEIPGYEEVNQPGLDKLVDYVKILLRK